MSIKNVLDHDNTWGLFSLNRITKKYKANFDDVELRFKLISINNVTICWLKIIQINYLTLNQYKFVICHTEIFVIGKFVSTSCQTTLTWKNTLISIRFKC